MGRRPICTHSIAICMEMDEVDAYAAGTVSTFHFQVLYVPTRRQETFALNSKRL